ncbi:MAG: hypothetical protein ACOX87_15100, partial [Chloroflexota bacterium]
EGVLGRQPNGSPHPVTRASTQRERAQRCGHASPTVVGEATRCFPREEGVLPTHRTQDSGRRTQD